jgi:hypothetical protein
MDLLGMAVSTFRTTLDVIPTPLDDTISSIGQHHNLTKLDIGFRLDSITWRTICSDMDHQVWSVLPQLRDLEIRVVTDGPCCVSVGKIWPTWTLPQVTSLILSADYLPTIASAMNWPLLDAPLLESFYGDIDITNLIRLCHLSKKLNNLTVRLQYSEHDDPDDNAPLDTDEDQSKFMDLFRTVAIDDNERRSTDIQSSEWKWSQLEVLNGMRFTYDVTMAFVNYIRALSSSMNNVSSFLYEVSIEPVDCTADELLIPLTQLPYLRKLRLFPQRRPSSIFGINEGEGDAHEGDDDDGTHSNNEMNRKSKQRSRTHHDNLKKLIIMERLEKLHVSCLLPSTWPRLQCPKLNHLHIDDESILHDTCLLTLLPMLSFPQLESLIVDVTSAILDQDIGQVASHTDSLWSKSLPSVSSKSSSLPTMEMRQAICNDRLPRLQRLVITDRVLLTTLMTQLHKSAGSLDISMPSSFSASLWLFPLPSSLTDLRIDDIQPLDTFIAAFQPLNRSFPNLLRLDLLLPHRPSSVASSRSRSRSVDDGVMTQAVADMVIITMPRLITLRLGSWHQISQMALKQLLDPRLHAPLHLTFDHSLSFNWDD